MRRQSDVEERSRRPADGSEHFETVIIGGGQAGLSVGYHLARRDRLFVILDANERIGDSWRKRWDSLRLFTPARYDGLQGMRFPAPAVSFPTKDEMADYLEAYAARFDLPDRTGVKVDGVSRQRNRYVVTSGGRRFEAEHVVVAAGANQLPKVPAFADELDSSIVQLHSSKYRNASQLQEGGVLLVGQPKFISHGAPLIRVKLKDLAAAGVEQVPRTVGVQDGRPALEDGRVLDVSNVIWCTGFREEFPWIDLPVFGEDGRPLHERGVVVGEPGLYFVGLLFQYAGSSDVLAGVGRDAEYIAKHIASREPNGQPTAHVLAGARRSGGGDDQEAGC